jgi:hypothetical protein
VSLATRLLNANPGAQVSNALTGALTTPGAKGAYSGVTGAFDALSTVIVPSGGLSTITFAGIPQTGYSHLQIRVLGRSLGAGTESNIAGTFNSDTSASYTTHYLQGNGSTTSSSYAGLAASEFYAGRQSASASTAGMFGIAIIDILNYANTNQNKTLRSLSGHDQNGSGELFYWSAVYLKTNAINSITLNCQGSGFAQNSQLALYGVK